jgi:hypothetical protein
LFEFWLTGQWQSRKGPLKLYLCEESAQDGVQVTNVFPGWRELEAEPSSSGNEANVRQHQQHDLEHSITTGLQVAHAHNHKHLDETTIQSKSRAPHPADAGHNHGKGKPTKKKKEKEKEKEEDEDYREDHCTKHPMAADCVTEMVCHHQS